MQLVVKYMCAARKRSLLLLSSSRLEFSEKLADVDDERDDVADEFPTASLPPAETRRTL